MRPLSINQPVNQNTPFMTEALPRLHLFGAGHAGRSLGRLWRQAGGEIGSLCNRSMASTLAAQTFIGAGVCLAQASDLQTRPGDCLLLGCSDDLLEQLASSLAALLGPAPANGIAFHLSGSRPAAALAPLAAQGWAIASLHPLRSFADPAAAVAQFAGTLLALEGDADALLRLRRIGQQLGGQCIEISSSAKPLYHAGAVFACNYLTALLELSLQCLAHAGLPRDLAWPALRPLIDGTLNNIGRLGPAGALSGPIARGDAALVAGQAAALAACDARLASAYRLLGEVAADLAAARGLPAERIAAVRQALQGAP